MDIQSVSFVLVMGFLDDLRFPILTSCGVEGVTKLATDGRTGKIVEEGAEYI